MSKKPKRLAKMMRPRDASTLDDVCSLPRDNITSGDYWALLMGDGGDSITLTKQRVGKNATESISITRRDFNRIVDWYMRPVKVTHGR